MPKNAKMPENGQDFQKAPEIVQYCLNFPRKCVELNFR
jgi:hypothetical protein